MAQALVPLPAPLLGEVRVQLEKAGLPFEDIGESGHLFYRLDVDGAATGWAGIEPYGADALLRSVVVPDQARGRTHGRLLISAIADQARSDGIERLWLLTNTAAGFFTKLGFSIVPREAAPAGIRSSSEFSSLCPASAICMMRALEPTRDLR
jgi:amino-acid N-acetyltransferase